MAERKTRFWAPRGGLIPVSEEGYLVEHGIFRRTGQLFELTPAQEPGCTVLLGEAGLGKTTEVRHLFEILQDEVPGRCLFLDLATFHSDTSLERALLDCELVREWRGGSGLFHLVLDGLDEGLFVMPNLPGVLERCLGQLPPDRLALCLACRPGEWPQSLGQFLASRFDQPLRVLELTPLRAQDVYAWAQEAGIEGEGFLAAVRERRAGSFAARPITLDLLVRLAGDPAGLPERTTELYERGCLTLADEWNHRRRGLPRAVALSSGQRLEIASWVAAAAVFTARPSLWLGPASEAPSESLTLDALVESVPGEWPVSAREALLEVVAMALFAPAGEAAVTWAHWSYAEFLSAWFCTRRSLPEPQLRALTCQNGNGSAQVVPRLRAVAGWLGTLSPAYRRQVLAGDPRAALEGDLGALDDSDRAVVLAGLLAAVNSGLPDPFHAYDHPGIRRLQFPGLAEALREAVSDRTRLRRVRVAALEIARACEVVSLGDLLADLALDPEEDIRVREAAARALSGLETPERARLVPLVTDPTLREADSDDQLFGCALRAVWPEHLALGDLLPSVRAPRREHFVGAYSLFLGNFERTIRGSFSGPELAQALAWVADQPADLLDALWGTSMAELALAALCRGWEVCLAAEDAAIEGSLAHAAAVHLLDRKPAHLRRALSELNVLVDQDAALRRRVFLAALDAVDWELNSGVSYLVLEPVRWVQDRDLRWLVEQARVAEPDRATFWYRLLDQLTFTELWHELVWDLCESAPRCREFFRSRLGAIPVDSPLADQAREQERRWQEIRAARQARPPAQQPLEPSTEILTERVERAHESERSFVNLQLILDQSVLVRDMTQCRYWERLSESQQQSVLHQAAQFLRIEGEPTTYQPGSVNALDMAGFRALFTLSIHRPEELESLPPSSWARWAAVCVGYPVDSGRGVYEAAGRVCTLAYRHAPQPLLSVLSQVLTHEADRGDFPLTVLEHFPGPWDAALQEHVYAFATSTPLGPLSLSYVVDELMLRESCQAQAWCLEQIHDREDGQRETFLLAAVALLKHAPRLGWEPVHQLMQEDPALAQEVFLHFADAADVGRLPSRLQRELGDQELGELYTWLVQRFPYAEDPEYNGRITSRHDVTDLRRQVLEELRVRGTPGALQALRQAREALPDEEWLDHMVAGVEEACTDSFHEPISLQALSELIRRSEARLVESGAQLLEVVLESLERIQRELQGELPSVRGLWNEVTKGVWRPKEEEELSDFVARFLGRDLKDRGVVLGREVQIRRGERTDVRVWAVAPDRGRLGLVVEVKGCWNKKVESDQQDQLCDRYLADNDDCSHGLYLVGHYQSDEWDEDDWRRSAKWSKRERAELSTLLEEQSRQLSTSDRTLASLVLDLGLR